MTLYLCYSLPTKKIAPISRPRLQQRNFPITRHSQQRTDIISLPIYLNAVIVISRFLLLMIFSVIIDAGNVSSAYLSNGSK